MNHFLFFLQLKDHNNQSTESGFVSGNIVTKNKLLMEINKEFGSFENFQKQFEQMALSLFGSGWTWLYCDMKQGGKLIIENFPNQDTPYMREGSPVFGIDVWEHSYYLKHQNRRADYLKAVWNVVDWNRCDELYNNAMSSGENHDEF